MWKQITFDSKELLCQQFVFQTYNTDLQHPYLQRLLTTPTYSICLQHRPKRPIYAQRIPTLNTDPPTYNTELFTILADLQQRPTSPSHLQHRPNNTDRQSRSTYNTDLLATPTYIYHRPTTPTDRHPVSTYNPGPLYNYIPHRLPSTDLQRWTTKPATTPTHNPITSVRNTHLKHRLATPKISISQIEPDHWALESFP